MEETTIDLPYAWSSFFNVIMRVHVIGEWSDLYFWRMSVLLMVDSNSSLLRKKSSLACLLEIPFDQVYFLCLYYLFSIHLLGKKFYTFL